MIPESIFMVLDGLGTNIHALVALGLACKRVTFEGDSVAPPNPEHPVG